jgi:hypothetical protein
MTIQQAIRSGKPFRRKAWESYISADQHFNKIIPKYIGRIVNSFSVFTVSDILAKDWEVKK